MVKIISPLLFTAPPIPVGCRLLHRNLIEFNLLKRYQYTLSYLTSYQATLQGNSSNSLRKKKKQRKPGCVELKRTSCTLQTTPDPALTYIPLVKPRRSHKYKCKYKYPSMPRVHCSHELNSVELQSQMLLSGYRPLCLDPVSICTGGSNNNTTMYEVSVDLTKLSGLQDHIWKSSAAGVEKYAEWDGIPWHVAQRLKPFVPPGAMKQDEGDVHLRDPHGLLKQVCEMIHKSMVLSKKG